MDSGMAEGLEVFRLEFWLVEGLKGWRRSGGWLEGARNAKKSYISPCTESEYLFQAVDLETPKSNQTCPILGWSLLSQSRQ